MMVIHKVATLLLACVLRCITAQSPYTTLISSSTLFCPGGEALLICSTNVEFLIWEVTIPGMTGSFSEVYNAPHVIGDARPLGSEEEFTLNITATDPLTSTLTTTVTPALDGTVVECTSAPTESLTLNLLSPPAPTASPTSMVAGQTANTISATVTVQWTPSTGADNYTVSVTPDLPSLGGPVTTTGTSLELQDVPYNTPHTVSIVVTNCAGSSAAAETMINIAGCVVPARPVNGDWQPFSPSTTVGSGSSLSLSCSPGYVPSEVMSSTCQSNGSWNPDTAELECIIDCGPPTPAANVLLEPPQPNNTTFGSTFSFRCAEGLFPNGTEQAVCGADGQWRPDPANHGCGDGNFDCGAPQPPASGSIAPHSSTLEGAVISFQCDQGFSPPEERPATCVRDEDTGSAVWEPNPAEHTCSRIETGTTPTTTATSGLATGAVVGIVVASVVVTLILILTAIAVAFIAVKHCRRGQHQYTSNSISPPSKAHNSGSHTVTTGSSAIAAKADIALSENVAYGPVVQRQGRGSIAEDPMYEEIPDWNELDRNVAYGHVA